MQPIDDGERVEFVPWNHLRPGERAGATSRHQLLALVGAVCVTLVVAGWWWANRADTAPVVPDATLVSTEAAGPLPLAPATTLAATAPVSAPVTEADLRAVAPESSERAVAAIASEYLRAYLSDETPEIHPYGVATTPVYVEWIEVISADVTDERWVVTMRVGLLEIGDNPRRPPISEYSVFVSLEDGFSEVSVPIRRAAHDQVVIERESLTEVPSTILEIVGLGTDEEILGGWEAAGSWYVMVRDGRGLPVAVEVRAP